MKARDYVSTFGIGIVAVICAAIALASVGYVVPQSSNQGIVVQTISGSPASVDFYPGTTGEGDIKGSTLQYSIGASSALNVVNATLKLQNSTTLLYNVTIAAANFETTYTLTGVQNWGVLYMNFTAANDTATFSSSTQTYKMNPTIGDVTTTSYGQYVIVTGGKLNDTMTSIGLYYGSLYIKDVEYIDGENVTILLSRRA